MVKDLWALAAVSAFLSAIFYWAPVVATVLAR